VQKSIRSSPTSSARHPQSRRCAQGPDRGSTVRGAPGAAARRPLRHPAIFREARPESSGRLSASAFSCAWAFRPCRPWPRRA
jgi:hypothetical protein